jgi:two-component system, OmpR family, sensor histidine kinase TctE
MLPPLPRGSSHVVSETQSAHLRDSSPPSRLSAVIRRQGGPSGTLTILAHRKLNSLTVTVMLALNFVTAPIFVLLALVALLVTPWQVRRSFTGVSQIAAEAEGIDPTRLAPERGVCPKRDRPLRSVR